MSATGADYRIVDQETEPRAIIRRQVAEWFRWIEGFLDTHRNNFVYRKPNEIQLAEHQRLFRESLRTSFLFLALIGDPDFNEPDLASRMQIRIRQLQDAYDTFHDTTLSDEQAEKLIASIFPDE